MAIRNYRDLKVWQRGVDLAVQCYQMTELFPTRELYGSGSLKELETQLWIANRLDFIDEPRLDEVLVGTAEVGRMLSGLKRNLRRRRSQLT